ncbi:transketolase family protein (plasmid) [Desulfobaculum bizertense]|uniref:transketolase family protein n=1 Tax=Desulfobaculum bizertense TaxID=376490 RepID=UPI001F384E98|nr:transketolase C-terminal domain-containing protein [Desulfobaculum bizertense]UIJ39564.1 transketolase family protein [Desulfobaculum bizertense]
MSQLFSETLEGLFAEDNRVVYLDADLMGSLKTQDLWDKYPNRVFNTGIQEANMVGVACGLFLGGFKPIIHSFSPFASRRVFDQLMVSVSYAHKDVTVIGSDAGICATFNGGTHMCFEDVAMLRSVPEATIIDVCDGVSFVELLKKAQNLKGLKYFRTARRGLPDVYSDTENFEFGKGKRIVAGTDVTIVASGIQLAEAIKAGKLLLNENISAEIIDPVTVKPLDEDLIIGSAKKTGLVITTENASIYGGLGDAVASVLAEHYPTRVVKNGIKDKFGQVGGMDYLRQQYELRDIDLVKMIKSLLKK